jgi:hypothetical protein
MSQFDLPITPKKKEKKKKQTYGGNTRFYFEV